MSMQEYSLVLTVIKQQWSRAGFDHASNEGDGRLASSLAGLEGIPCWSPRRKRNSIVYIQCKCENKASLISRYVRMATIGERQTTPFECLV